RVIREAGYDGEYGVIRLFEDGELKQMNGGLLFDVPVAAKKKDKAVADESSAQAPSVGQELRRPSAHGCDLSPQAGTGDSRQRRSECDDPSRLGQGPKKLLAGLDDDQRRAAETIDGPLLIIAGPGSGKTRTLTHRIAHIIADHNVAADQCL